ncbi:MAG: ribosome biogenesis GTPase Der [Gammaproteobacteria bacterium]|nr:ribosome biogenesis GTPase Der [Gammaproteobacteria bacterium]
MIPVVAIVGRPNVGKSTLFNCLTLTRNALVSDLPGMTRDRQYGEVNVGNHRFIVIDTGGLTNEKDDLNKLTADQSLQAVEEADKILFLVDGRAGVTAADIAIAEKLRSFKKPIFLTVNKTEGLDDNLAIAEFYRFGFGTPIPIAAAHKSGITELVESLFANESTSDEAIIETEKGIKLAIIGRPNVGKSTLTNRMLGEDRVIVYDHPGTTRDSIFIPLVRNDTRYTLIDTAGVRQRGKVSETTEKFSVVKTLQAIDTANVVLFVLDAREGVTDQDLKLLGFILQTGRAIVIALNKWDGMSLSDRENARKTIDRRLDFMTFARVHYISALHGTGVGNLFESIDEAYASAIKKFSTPQLTKVLTAAVNTHTPPLVNGRRIKLRYAHTGGHNPPIIVIHGNQVDRLPDSYIHYLANTFQKRLKLIGTPVKIELKNSINPFREKKVTLTARQQTKRKRLMQHVKKKNKN